VRQSLVFVLLVGRQDSSDNTSGRVDARPELVHEAGRRKIRSSARGGRIKKEKKGKEKKAPKA